MSYYDDRRYERLVTSAQQVYDKFIDWFTPDFVMALYPESVITFLNLNWRELAQRFACRAVWSTLFQNGPRKVSYYVVNTKNDNNTTACLQWISDQTSVPTPNLIRLSTFC